jgi:NhaA family Na+:H+ antiporter
MSEHAQGGHRSALDILQEFSIPLLVGVVGAVIWANIDYNQYHHFVHHSLVGGKGHFNLHFVINDIFMVLFFGIAAKEITESVLPGGALNPPRKAINPLLGTLGGVLGPAGFYFAWVAITGDKSIINGWGIPTATDIALAWLVARLAFGNDHPAVSFLLLLAVADDGIGLAIIAIFYPDPHHPVQPLFVGLVVLGMIVSWGLNKAKVNSFWPYVLVGGGLSWAGLFLAHLHPALTLVPIVPFMPHAGKDEGLFAEGRMSHRHTDTLNRFEHFFKRPVDMGLLFFGLANAGVQLAGIGNATYGVLLALVIGKTFGIFSFSMVGKLAGFPLPEGMDGKSLFVAGMIAALGLTVALFVAGVAFTDDTLQGAAKMGALMSAGVAPVALLTAKLLGIKKVDNSSSAAAH